MHKQKPGYFPIYDHIRVHQNIWISLLIKAQGTNKGWPMNGNIYVTIYSTVTQEEHKIYTKTEESLERFLYSC